MRSCILIVTLLGLSSCGGPKKVDFPVDDGKTLATLSPADYQAMCVSVLDYAQDAFELVCLSEGLAAKFQPGASEQACQTAVASCQAEYAAKPPNCELADTKALAGCAATVGEYEACLNDMLAMMDKVQGRMSCSISMSDMQQLAVEMQNMQTQPPSCQAVGAKCPGLTGGGEDAGPR